LLAQLEVWNASNGFHPLLITDAAKLLRLDELLFVNEYKPSVIIFVMQEISKVQELLWL